MKLKGRFQSLGTQLIVSVMIISLLVLAAASYALYSFMLDMIKEQNEKTLHQQFQQLDHNIHAVASDIDRLSNLLKLDNSIQSLLTSQDDPNDYEFVTYKSNLLNRIETYIGNYTYIHSIYFFSEQTGAIGGNVKSTLVHSEQSWDDAFIASEAYRRAQEASPLLTVNGGVPYSFYNPYKTGGSDGNLISMMRTVRATLRPSAGGVLIFNIDERYLSTIYANDSEANSGDMYIVDGDGRVISAGRPERVGTDSPFMPDNGASYGSHDVTRDGSQVQLVYYKLQDSDWYLMKEVPLSQYSHQIYKVQRLLVLVFLVSVLMMFAISYFWLRKMLKPMHRLSVMMREMSGGELGITIREVPNNEIGTVIRRFNDMSLSMVDLIDKNNEIQEQKRILEIEALQYQINPHFLYNTLNMVRWMASDIKADNIVNSIVALGNILRAAYTNKNTMCSLRDELSYLDNYVKIINLRFNDGVAYEVEADEDALDDTVPRFILQPLVENAIASGSHSEDRVVTIKISARREADLLVIVVSDTGAGIQTDQLEEMNDRLREGFEIERTGSGNGIGLQNVNKRIRLYYGDEYGIQFVPVAKGATVVLRLPAQA
ncbi:sensor histidine kinase [Cohnella sp. GCM10027633]|uniref:cache domain-containing sensor histidine kinase n=1 Tax=unclassified Cohnella TaxID=2636738 RepID=UPI0036424AA0